MKRDTEIVFADHKATDWESSDVDKIFAPLDPVNYLIAPLDLCPGAPALVAGYGFSGKTVALQSVAISIAAGKPVWGRFDSRQGSVIHVDYEQGARLTRERYQRLAAGMGVTPDAVAGNLNLVTLPSVYIDDPKADSFFTDKFAKQDLAIVDSLGAAHGDSFDENSASIRRALDMFTRVSERTGCCVVVIHHTRKPSLQKSGGGSKMAIRGSGAIFAACGSVLLLDGEKGGPVRVEHEKARASGVTLDDFMLRIEDVEIDGNRRGGLAVNAEPVGMTPSKNVKPVADDIRRRVLDYLRQNGSQPSVNKIREALGVNRGDIYSVVGQLKAEGVIVNTGTDKKPNLQLAPLN